MSFKPMLQVAVLALLADGAQAMTPALKHTGITQAGSTPADRPATVRSTA